MLYIGKRFIINKELFWHDYTRRWYENILEHKRFGGIMKRKTKNDRYDFLKDIRLEENDIYTVLINDLGVDYHNLSESVKNKLYYSMKENRPDPERRKIALQSYMKYPFWNEQYTIKDGFIWYEVNKTLMKITADLLSSSKIADLIEEKYQNDIKDGEEKIIAAYRRCVFTIGNCCPVLKNKSEGRRAEDDQIINKLEKQITDKVEQSIEMISKDEKKIKNLNCRKGINIFILWSDCEKIEKEQIINKLYLNDYYDNGKLIYAWEKVSEALKSDENDKKSREYVFEYLKKISILIIKRGYRISNIGKDMPEQDIKNLCKWLDN